ncbi:MAG: hypothetical protein AN485_23675, partial [Anabaena sp. MDT14b]
MALRLSPVHQAAERFGIPVLTPSTLRTPEALDEFRSHQADVAIVADLLRELQPDLIFVAGDLSDPHGTHRMCKEAIDLAVAEVYGGDAAAKCPEIWLYRGAWQEWPVTEATVLVPLSQEELTLKIQAIFKHQSQKDSAPFPGQDEREFWQRVEQRNKT